MYIINVCTLYIARMHIIYLYILINANAWQNFTAPRATSLLGVLSLGTASKEIPMFNIIYNRGRQFYL